MSVAGRLGRRAGAVLHPRICAAVTAASCLAHLWFAAGNQHGTWLNLLMLAMVAVCLPCAVHIWRHGRVGAVRRVSTVGLVGTDGQISVFRGAGAVRQVMASALVMTGVHAALLLGVGAGASHAHHGGAAASAAAAAAPAASVVPAGSAMMLAVIALELTTALVAATLLARLRARRAE